MESPSVRQGQNLPPEPLLVVTNGGRALLASTETGEVVAKCCNPGQPREGTGLTSEVTTVTGVWGML